jgi:hypothetical protein
MMKAKILSLITILFFHLSSFSQIPPYVPTNGLVGYWGFNGNANDESGINNHGIATNVVLTSDRFGNANSAYQFNGINSRISINNAFFNSGWESFTISCWTYSTNFLNPNNVNDSQVIINTDPHNGIAITLYGQNNPFRDNFDNKYIFLAGSKPNVKSWDIVEYTGYSNTTRTINTWNHLVLIKTGNTYKFYINGVLDKTVVGNKPADSYLSKIVLGALASNITPEVFLGKLDDYGIWNRALTQSEITGLMNKNCNICVPFEIRKSNK